MQQQQGSTTDPLSIAFFTVAFVIMLLMLALPSMQPLLWTIAFALAGPYYLYNSYKTLRQNQGRWYRQPSLYIAIGFFLAIPYNIVRYNFLGNWQRYDGIMTIVAFVGSAFFIIGFGLFVYKLARRFL